MTYTLQSKSIFWPAANNDLIIIQCFLKAVIHLIHEWGSRILCPDPRPFDLRIDNLLASSELNIYSNHLTSGKILMAPLTMTLAAKNW